MASAGPPRPEELLCVRGPGREGRARVWRALALLQQGHRPRPAAQGSASQAPTRDATQASGGRFLTRAALYARVSPAQQAREETVARQVALLPQTAAAHGDAVLPGPVFLEDGSRGTRLDRPALAGWRALAAEGAVEVMLVPAPDRLARRYADQDASPGGIRPRAPRLAARRPPPTAREQRDGSGDRAAALPLVCGGAVACLRPSCASHGAGPPTPDVLTRGVGATSCDGNPAGRSRYRGSVRPAAAKIARLARARAAPGARRPNGSRSGGRRAPLPRPGSGPRPNSAGIGRGRSATPRTIALACGVGWSVGAGAGAWSAPGGPRAGGLWGPSAPHGRGRERAWAAAWGQRRLRRGVVRPRGVTEARGARAWRCRGRGPRRTGAGAPRTEAHGPRPR